MNSQCEKHNWLKVSEFAPKPFPIVTNENFKIAVVIEKSSFALALNGKKLGNFEFRENPEKMFANMNGIEVFSNEGSTVNIRSFEYFEMEENCPDFEVYVTETIS